VWQLSRRVGSTSILKSESNATAFKNPHPAKQTGGTLAFINPAHLTEEEFDIFDPSHF